MTVFLKWRFSTGNEGRHRFENNMSISRVLSGIKKPLRNSGTKVFSILDRFRQNSNSAKKICLLKIPGDY